MHRIIWCALWKWGYERGYRYAILGPECPKRTTSPRLKRMFHNSFYRGWWEGFDDGADDYNRQTEELGLAH